MSRWRAAPSMGASSLTAPRTLMGWRGFFCVSSFSRIAALREEQLSNAETYRKRAEQIARELRRRSRNSNRPLVRKKEALEALAENEDWLAGAISPEIPTSEIRAKTRRDRGEDVLRFVTVHPGLTVTELAEGLHMRESATHYFMQRFLKEGLVERRGSGVPGDRYLFFAIQR